MLGKKENGTVSSGGQTLNTIIGRGTLFEGTMQVENSVRVDGTFKGELTCSGALTISQSGEAYAQLEGKDIYRARPRNLWVKGPGFSDGYWGG